MYLQGLDHYSVAYAYSPFAGFHLVIGWRWEYLPCHASNNRTNHRSVEALELPMPIL